jgi:hypothetical protein
LIVFGEFEPTPYRSWPWPRTRLEQLAKQAGVDDEELRAYLHAEVERRRRERGPSVAQSSKNGSAEQSGGEAGNGVAMPLPATAGHDPPPL